jgi:hypothetical protein
MIKPKQKENKMKFTGKLTGNGDLIFLNGDEEVVITPMGTPKSHLVEILEDSEERKQIDAVLNSIDYLLILKNEVIRMEKMLVDYKRLTKSDFRRLCKIQEAYRVYTTDGTYVPPTEPVKEFIFL